MAKIKKNYNRFLVTFNIHNFEFSEYWSFDIWLFQILTPTHKIFQFQVFI